MANKAELKTKTSEGIEFRLGSLKALHEQIVLTGKLDKNGEKVILWAGKNRFVLCKFLKWVKENWEETESAREGIVAALAAEPIEGKPQLTNDEADKQWKEIMDNRVGYTGPVIHADEAFFEQCPLDTESINHLGGFLKLA
jgi:hypothetical protein